MADIAIVNVNGVYKPTYNWGAPSCGDPPVFFTETQDVVGIYGYHLVMTFTVCHGKSPFVGKPSISMGHLYHGYVK